MPTAPDLIVLRARGLGDFLTAVPAYRALARTYPDHRRWLAAPRELACLLPLAPFFHGLLPTESLEKIPWFGPAPDLAVNLHGCGPDSHRALLALAPRRLLAYAHPAVPGSQRGPSWSEDEHEVSRWVRLLQSAGILCDAGALDIDPPEGPCRAPRGCTVICPGAASAARRWPVERWAAIARDEVHAGYRVYVTGSYEERALVCELARRADLDVARATAVGLGPSELARVIDRAGLVLCGDCGTGQLATALRKPSVLLFGPSSPARRGPPLQRPWHRVLWAGSESDPLEERSDAGLLQISVVDVEKEVAALRRSLRLTSYEAATWPLFTPELTSIPRV